MDYKKIAIIGSISAVVGGLIVVLIIYRAKHLQTPVQSQPTPIVVTPPSLTSSGTQSPLTGLPGTTTTTTTTTTPPPPPPPPTTTIDPSQPPTTCNVKVPNLDCDFDSLNNADEATHKTDPLKSDTDGDGLSDFSEVVEYQSDPLNQHSIDPSMTDSQAVDAGKKNTR